MAITKIMCMKSAEHGNASTHLKHSIEYICNEAKTENGSLVGSINCLPDFAYEQMLGTKEMFGKTGGRQGYHFIISLKPGEGTKEQMLEIVQRFAKEFLGDEYEAVYSVHTDKNHLHAHLVFNSVNMLTGQKYDYQKGDWKYLIQPLINRLCEKYGVSIVAAEYSKDPVNMNRKLWENEKSWSDFIAGDMQYCRRNAKNMEEFVFLMKKLGYEVKVGAHISVKAEAMKRSRRLDTLDEEFTLPKLEEYFEKPMYKREYVAPPVYSPGYALSMKPRNSFQARYHGKLYCMCVVQKYRFQHNYTRYKEDLLRMKELQEEYLFLRREDVKGWEDVVRIQVQANRRVAVIDRKKKMLYNEHARYRYQYEKDGDERNYLCHEVKYREELEELKKQRKEAKQEYEVATRCMKESTLAHMEIPLDVDIDNLYEVDVPKPVKETNISTQQRDDSQYQQLNGSYNWTEQVTEQEAKLPEGEADELVESVPISASDNQEEIAHVPSEVMQPKALTESVTKSETITNAKANAPIQAEPAMTRHRYEALTDKEKVEWMGLCNYGIDDAINVFGEKMKSLGIQFKYGSDMLDEYMRLEAVAEQMRRKDGDMRKNILRQKTQGNGRYR